MHNLDLTVAIMSFDHLVATAWLPHVVGERGGSVVECRTPEREVRGSRPTAAVLCPWARHFTPRKYWLITQEAMAPSRYDWKIVDWDVKPQHNQPHVVNVGVNMHSDENPGGGSCIECYVITVMVSEILELALMLWQCDQHRSLR